MIYTQTVDPVIEHVRDTLSRHLLSGARVLWLLSGGSAIGLEVRIAEALQVLDVSRLSIGLVDERYGQPGHDNENYLQLTQAQFPLPIARVLRGESPEDTTAVYTQYIKRALDEADFSLGIFGIGADGHTAGIKPHSPAVASTDSVLYYEWDDYERITITPPFIQRLDEAVIYAAGQEKASTLRALIQTKLPPEGQPAQLLKEHPRSSLYTDIA